MTVEDMTPKQLEEMHLRVGRKLQEPPSFAEVADDGVDEQEYGSPAVQRAERSVAKLIAEQDEAQTGIESEDFENLADLPSTGDPALDLKEQIEETRGLLSDAAGNPELIEELSYQLDVLQQRSAVIAVAAKMQEQELEKENDAFLADMDDEDL